MLEEPPLEMIAKIKAWWLFRCCTDIVWRQSLPSTAWNISDQCRHETEHRTLGETLCQCENQNPAQLILCHCHSSAASLHNLNSSFCSLCWSSTWLYQMPLLNARHKTQNCHCSAPGNTFPATDWDAMRFCPKSHLHCKSRGRTWVRWTFLPWVYLFQSITFCSRQGMH